MPAEHLRALWCFTEAGLYVWEQTISSSRVGKPLFTTERGVEQHRWHSGAAMPAASGTDVVALCRAIDAGVWHCRYRQGRV